MTTITTPAVWYIAVALPFLIATVGAVFIINRATVYLQSRKIKRQQNDQSGRYSGISWNAPWSWLAKITYTSFGGSIAGNTVSLDKALSSSLGSPSHEQPESSTGVLDNQSPSQKPPEASTRIFNKRVWTIIHFGKGNTRREIPGQHSSENENSCVPRVCEENTATDTSTSTGAYAYRVTGVAMVDSLDITLPTTTGG